MEWFSWPLLALSVAVLLVTGAAIAWGVRLLERQSRRDAEATRIQERLTEPLSREPALRGSSVLPATSVPAGGPVRVELTGWVTSEQARATAVRLVEQEARALDCPVEVVDRLAVVATPDGDARRSA
ncbi:MAG TPA: hypothetical protein VNN07_00370 [Candidatus Tectomicrobia bacterium]|nr:hypothetical protein [Candidatus Tectomicrobia bacterium]